MQKGYTRRDLLDTGFKLAVAAGIGSMLPGLTGCGKSGPASSGAAGNTAGGTLSFYDWARKPETGGALDSQLALFTKDSGINVKVIPPAAGDPVSVVQKMQLMVQSGTAPDVWTQDGSIAAYVTSGIPEPLDSYIQASKLDLSHISQFALDVHTYQGKLYTIPHYTWVQVMTYNVDLFEQAGVPKPPRTWDDPSWTMETFQAAARKLTTRDSSGKFVQIGAWGMNAWWFPWLFKQNWISDDGKKMNTTHPDFIRALKFLQDLVYVDKAMPKPTDAQQMQTQGDPFLSGKVALKISSTSEIVQYAKADKLRWDICPLPKGLTSFGYVSPVGIALTKDGKQKQKAWELLKWMADPKHNGAFGTAYGNAPASKAALPEWMKAQSEKRPGVNYQLVADVISKYFPPSNFWAFVAHAQFRALYAQVVTPGLDKLFAGTDKPENAPDSVAKWMNEEGNRVLAGG